ncbi:CoA transferase, partial [Nocardia xishanensis]
AGHDINYISLTGVLNAIGRKGERPVPPLNMVGDFGGGSMFLVFGILAALVERQSSGKGQVIDAAMIDGALALSHMIWGMRGVGLWSDERGTNLLDTGMAFYDTYETSDGKYMAVGAIEPQFYAELLKGLEIDPEGLPMQIDPNGQDQLKKLFAEKFKTKTRDEWAAIFEGTDACTTPVLTMTEATENAHIAARNGLVDIDGVVQHAPAPRFSRTPAAIPTPPPAEATPIESVWAD